MIHTISAEPLSIEQLGEVIRSGARIELSQQSKQRVIDCRIYLEKKLEESTSPIYGINTGFGSLCDTSIGKESLSQLQHNLVMSHACGTGSRIDKQLVKVMLLLKIQSLAYGNSGVRLELLDRLVWHFNEDVLPVVYEQGSLGASGDLAPLAHLALPLIGKGEVWQDDEVKLAEDVLRHYGVSPLALQSKEGLALLNGTQFMSAYGIMAAVKGWRLLSRADVIAAISLEAFDGRIDAFNDSVQAIRRHPGQRAVAKHIRDILEGSELITAEKKHVQDPYSFRCIPQVHGASRDAYDYFRGVFEREVDSVTDNPTIFPETDEIVSAGNFHGQPLALASDFFAIAMAELGSISERRIYKLVNGERGLPDFLVANPGLNSGFMIPQYTAASIVSRNKQLCTPASVDTIDSSNGQEDHVSMGANSVVKLLQVIDHVETILAIELLVACQALDFREVAATSPFIKDIYAEFRAQVAFVNEDRELYPLIQKAKTFVGSITTTHGLVTPTN
jgi:histidine ammonia-lyase